MPISNSPDGNRARYEAALRRIESDLVRMGQTVIEMVDLAVRTAIDDDAALAAGVLERETTVDAMHHELMDRVIVMLAMEQPVAGDLLLLTATFAMVGELEKVGDEATKLVTRVSKLQGTFPYELNELLNEMSRYARANIQEALRLYNQFSLEGAERLVAQDDVVDKTYKTSRNLLLVRMRDEPQNLRQLLRCAEIFHALEHVSDHTVDMAKHLRGCYERYQADVIAQ